MHSKVDWRLKFSLFKPAFNIGELDSLVEFWDMYIQCYYDVTGRILKMHLYYYDLYFDLSCQVLTVYNCVSLSLIVCLSDVILFLFSLFTYSCIVKCIAYVT